ncbi:MAG: Asp-tRNA(Asn)/Glu-tRNA(Gln) amidotransferase subunit GatC [Coriobacteriales bacterium]|jgi:aspartyl-tRNA(Asn)/glutamyl-tRNA(Gln) amidotransferase subunit C|nr:Asp-tRNA(Asn)/Glu-tRNA(Gln) amidotransferase subunit GatC [Coriobacteriales bacterium]
MYLTENDVRGIATYARIGLADDEVKAMTIDLNNIIESLKPITEYDLTGVEPTFHPIAGLVNVMRDDIQIDGLAHNDAMQNAPSSADGQFRIPPILGDGGEA